MVVTLTNRVKRLFICPPASQRPVQHWPLAGGSHVCAVNCDHLQTVARGRLGTLITTLSDAKLTAVSHAVRFALNL
ncbi:MAG: type II toxin-antitoxin system PemK/MazF family toxin [Lentisphaerae bacterium]|nr:type II toxin-antitoxin system PemK/MazF family toxin [Lentisphaerota bacterium]